MFSALEAAGAAAILAATPRGGAGFSFARWSLLGILAVAIVLLLYLAVRLPSQLEYLIRYRYIVAFAVAALLGAIALFLLRYLDPSSLLPYYERLGIPLWYLTVLSIQSCLFLMLARFGWHRPGTDGATPGARPAAIAFGGLLLAALIIAISRVGLTPDAAYWGEPGVPIQGWQFALALLAGLSAFVAGLGVRAKMRVDPWLAVGVWLLAVAVWLSVPVAVMRNSFYAPIDPPANQPFPNSDAGYYDTMAESLLIGHPYQGQIAARPLYITLLTTLHLAVGENYPYIIAGQTLVLACIPVLLYLVGKSLHSRTAGITAALFAIFRELSTILVSSDTRVSNTKTLLVDLPTLLLLLVVCWLALRWFKAKGLKNAVAAGGGFGLLLLLRTQTVFLVPVLLGLCALVYGFRDRQWLVAVAGFLAALIATLAPWIVHNYVESGRLVFDAPFQYQVLASQYRYTGNLDINSVDLQGKSLIGILVAFAARDPGFVMSFVANHSLATLIGGILAFPLIEHYSGLNAPVNLYWLNWAGQLSWYNGGLVVLYLGVIAVGLGAAWRRHRWVGLLPLAFCVGYSLSNGIGRFSGWRYDLPADWVWYFYFAIGFADLLLLFSRFLGRRSNGGIPGLHTRQHSNLGSSVGPSLLFILIGALPWLAQGISDPRYTSVSEAQWTQRVTSASSVEALGISEGEVEAFLTSPGGTIQVGRALYPRFFSRGNGLASAHPWPAYAPRDFARMGFLLLNQTSHDMVFPTRQAPSGLAHAADVVVLGCSMHDYVNVRLLYVPDQDLAYTSGPLTEPCP